MEEQIEGLSNRKIKVKIEGTASLMMNNDKFMADEQGDTIDVVKTEGKYDPAKDAKRRRYTMDYKGKEVLCFNSKHIRGALINACKFYNPKGIGSKVSLKNLFRASVRIEPMNIPLLNNDKPALADNYKLHKDVLAPPRQGKRPITRPQIDKWSAEFTLRKLFEKVHDNDLKTLVQHAGLVSGLLDNRPQMNGDFGTFKVVKFEPED